MKQTTKALLFLVLAYALSTTSAAPAWAALGGAPETPATGDQDAPAVKRATTVHAGYTVQESTSEILSIREYTSPDNVVFGVAWSGMGKPDLEKLLGAYAAEYNAAVSQTPRSRGKRSQHIATDRIVVEQSGFLRNRSGRAYAPELIPQGVSFDEIQ